MTPGQRVGAGDAPCRNLFYLLRAGLYGLKYSTVYPPSSQVKAANMVRNNPLITVNISGLSCAAHAAVYKRINEDCTYLIQDGKTAKRYNFTLVKK